MVIVSGGILKSRLLNKELPYQVVLPTEYARTQKKFPVLYLLHGLFGNCRNWLELTQLKEYASDYELIIVTPEAEESWYVDSPVIEQNKFESHFILELIPEIEDLYRVKGKKESRAVVGLSMGGYGALKFGLKYPDLFVFAGSMSGAFDAPLRTNSNPGFDWESLKPSILKAFGGQNSPVRSENDLFRIIPAITEKHNIPAIYLDCGKNDGFLQTNLELQHLLQEKGILHKCFFEEGGHDWNYWDRRIKIILKIMSDYVI